VEFLNFLKMIRSYIVAGGILSFSLGTLLGIIEGGIFKPTPVILAYTVVFLGDLSTHFSNDYFDIEIDKHAQPNFFSGKKILVNNPQLRPAARNISLTLLVLSNVTAAVLVLFFEAPTELLIITLTANLLGWIYSAPPLRLSSRTLGEITIAVATGFIIPSIGYLSVKGQLDFPFFVLSIPFMMYGFLLSLNLQAPDIEIDRKWKKKTFATHTGKRNIFFVVLAIASLATLTLFGLWWQTKLNFDLTAFALSSFIPLAGGLLGFALHFKKKDLKKFSNLNVFSLFLFITALNINCLLLLQQTVV
jgi:1,4-dihydroxy-2-naphthoate octaprenyltransferase